MIKTHDWNAIRDYQMEYSRKCLDNSITDQYFNQYQMHMSAFLARTKKHLQNAIRDLLPKECVKSNIEINGDKMHVFIKKSAVAVSDIYFYNNLYKPGDVAILNRNFLFESDKERLNANNGYFFPKTKSFFAVSEYQKTFFATQLDLGSLLLCANVDFPKDLLSSQYNFLNKKLAAEGRRCGEWKNGCKIENNFETFMFLGWGIAKYRGYFSQKDSYTISARWLTASGNILKTWLPLKAISLAKEMV